MQDLNKSGFIRVPFRKVYFEYGTGDPSWQGQEKNSDKTVVAIDQVIWENCEDLRGKIDWRYGIVDVVKMIECLPHMYKALNFVPNTKPGT